MPEREDIFRANDIRGIYPDTLDEKIAEEIGMAFGTFLGKNKTIALSMDIRKSSPMLKESFLKGLKSTGTKVLYIGKVPTPMLYFAIAHYNLDGGAAVSASHNPPMWNGLKLCGPKGKTYGEDFGLKKIKGIYLSKKFSLREGGNSHDVSRKLMRDYENYLFKRTKVNKVFKVGVDPGNGADSKIASRILKKAGMFPVSINDKPDGAFPSRSPEPKPENITALRELVKKNNLDFGVAFDGDGDRAMFVDDKGEAFFGDTILAMMINNTVKKGEMVVYEISSSKAVEDVINQKRAKGIRTKTGRAFIIDKMLKNKAKLGGEYSTHFYFSDIYCFDDALFAVIKLAQILSERGRSMSELINELPKYEVVSSEFDVKESEKFRIISKMAKNLKKYKKSRIVLLDGVKFITDKGWFIARASNTTPKIKIKAESDNREDLAEINRIALKEYGLAKDSISK